MNELKTLSDKELIERIYLFDSYEIDKIEKIIDEILKRDSELSANNQEIIKKAREYIEKENSNQQKNKGNAKFSIKKTIYGILFLITSIVFFFVLSIIMILGNSIYTSTKESLNYDYGILNLGALIFFSPILIGLPIVVVSILIIMIVIFHRRSK